MCSEKKRKKENPNLPTGGQLVRSHACTHPRVSRPLKMGVRREERGEAFEDDVDRLVGPIQLQGQRRSKLRRGAATDHQPLRNCLRPGRELLLRKLLTNLWCTQGASSR
ncbi:hypothetical protein BaRGS_00019634 [Batillaria attramentaria]|uniref:Uncharacterized protein n=1 Tax=Batillaria attramentaria TaxID=370345 RepID=A0ABD0KPF1_9CAEN